MATLVRTFIGSKNGTEVFRNEVRIPFYSIPGVPAIPQIPEFPSLPLEVGLSGLQVPEFTIEIEDRIE